MAVSGVVGTKRDGILTLKDGAASTFQCTLEVGDFTFEEPKADRVVVRDRGAISGLRAGDDAVGSCSFSVHFTEFTNGSAGTLFDWIYRRGSMSAGTSVGGTGYEQFLLDLDFECDKTTLGDAAIAKVTLGKVLLFASFAEGDLDSVAVTGEIYGSYAYTGIA